jgi:uncharacterized protein (DUF2252 family)
MNLTGKKHLISPHQRDRVLRRCRTEKMARSVHAYVRGSTAEFYQWLNAGEGSSLPSGPQIWICGDCHVGNLGPVAGPDGKVEIGLRDFDQAVVGNPAHDLLRLALSLATAARSSDLPGITTAQILEAMIHGYEKGVRRPHTGSIPALGKAQPVRLILRQALKRKWRDLAKERIGDARPNIPLGKCFWPLSKQEQREIHELFATAELRRLISGLRNRSHDDGIEVVDAAYWRKGCSSLGRLRYAVLARLDEKKDGVRYCLLDIKEAWNPSAPRAKGAHMPSDPAKRVLLGARQLCPPLGERMIASSLCGRPICVRELRPQDLKVELEQLSREEAVGTAAFLAEVLGRAHSRQMTPAIRRDWLSILRRTRSRKLNAPSWLWTGVVDLTAIHQKAYLQFCREYALGLG